MIHESAHSTQVEVEYTVQKKEVQTIRDGVWNLDYADECKGWRGCEMGLQVVYSP